MSRVIQVGEPTAVRRRVHFHLVGTDGLTPANGEAGGQPQVSVDDAAWTDTGVGVLVLVGNGRYYAELTTGVLAAAGTWIETRYKSATTAECPGDSVQVDWAPLETTGRPTGLLGRLLRLYEGRFNKRTRDRSSGAMKVRNAADAADLSTQTQSTSGSTDTITKEV